MSILTRLLGPREERSGQYVSEEPSNWLMRAIRAAPSRTGVNVTHDTALSSTAVFAGVRLISESVGSIPLQPYRRREERGRDVAREHRLYRLLHDEPNPEQTSMEMREMVQGFATMAGTGFIEIERDGGGHPKHLWPITPHRVTAFRDRAGKLFWMVRTPNGGDRRVHADSMIPIRGFSRGGVFGVDVIQLMRESIGLTLAAEEYGARFFGSGSTVSGVLEHPEKISKDAQERLRDSWQEIHSGLENAHRIAILEEGMTWKQIGANPQHAQMIETRKFQVAEVARILNLPPHLLRDLERATYSNVEHQGIEFVTISIRPWCVRWEQALKKYLLTEEEKRTMYIEHTLEGLLRGDLKSRNEAYAIGRQWGWYSANDVNELENRNPLPGKQGDLYLVPVNMVSAERLLDPDYRGQPAKEEK
jgi:HK97 family phage portal protein